MATSVKLSLAGVLTETFRTLNTDLFNSYRPELHYMRGPGPKWREKHELRLQPVAAHRRSPGVGHFRPRIPYASALFLSGKPVAAGADQEPHKNGGYWKREYPPARERVSVQLPRNTQSCGNQRETSATKTLLSKTQQSEHSRQPPPDYVLRTTWRCLARRSSIGDVPEAMA